MTNLELRRIENIKSMRVALVIFWTAVKLVTAYFIINFIEQGILIVIGYLIFIIEYQSSLVFLNSQETSYHIGQLYNHEAVDTSDLIKELEDLKVRLSDVELRLVESENSIEDLRDGF